MAKRTDNQSFSLCLLPPELLVPAHKEHTYKSCSLALNHLFLHRKLQVSGFQNPLDNELFQIFSIGQWPSSTSAGLFPCW